MTTISPTATRNSLSDAEQARQLAALRSLSGGRITFHPDHPVRLEHWSSTNTVATASGFSVQQRDGTAGPLLTLEEAAEYLQQGAPADVWVE